MLSVVELMSRLTSDLESFVDVADRLLGMPVAWMELVKSPDLDAEEVLGNTATFRDLEDMMKKKLDPLEIRYLDAFKIIREKKWSIISRIINFQGPEFFEQTKNYVTIKQLRWALSLCFQKGIFIDRLSQIIFMENFEPFIQWAKNYNEQLSNRPAFMNGCIVPPKEYWREYV